MKVIPKVCSLKTDDGKFEFSASTKLQTSDDVMRLLLSDMLLSEGKENEVLFSDDTSLGDEDYRLSVGESVEIAASSQRGFLHGLATLKQLIFENLNDDKTKYAKNESISLKNKNRSENSPSVISKIPYCIIEDSPRFAYRGYMLDVSRHFFGVSTIKKILDALWLLKLNVFHLHLCDNQGFRLEIESLPKLHEIGSVRKQTRGDGVELKGFYTKSEIAEIIKYADERGIEVIPEIDMPGHTIAMLAAYPELSCTEKPIEVAERFGIVREILCAGKESVFEFLFKLLDEVAKLFPSKYIHIGGDEAPKYQWEECAACRNAVKKNGLRDMEDLQGYFTNRIIDHLKTLGKTAIVWNESLNSGILDESAVCQYWQDGKVPERVFAAADRGRKTIISKFSPYYLDYPYGMFSLKKTYLFEPLMDGMSTQGAKNIWGIESPLWTEYVPDEEKLFYQTFPRLIAVAESAWTKCEKDFDDFKMRLPLMQRMLDEISVAGASINESLPNPMKGMLKVAKFVVNAVDKEMIKSAINAKKVKETRRTE
ncbi:MAG: beta-N-acetylhexosaminidase [Clostridia bacterium]|nr:beta-N-acetylhexosaminidase [Clostridia bacterium]